MTGVVAVMLGSWLVVTFLLGFVGGQGLIFTVKPVDSVGVEGQPFWWHCSASGAVSYSWRFNDAYIPNSADYQTFQNGSLLITNVRQSDIGGYQCVANDGITSTFSLTAFLSLAYLSTTFKIQPRTEYKTTGEAVTFMCQIEGVPPPVITWQHNGQEVVNRTITMVTQEMSVLSLNNIKFEDEGQYMCVARNPLMNQVSYSNSANLVLRGKPELKVAPLPVSVPVGQSAVFHCLAVGEPAPAVTWYDSRNVLSELPIPTVVDMKYFVYSNGTLLIQNIQKNEAGFYTCKARNSLGETSKTVLLTVTDETTQPVFTVTPNTTIVFEGETVQWVCAATGTPDPVITWSRLAQDLPLERLAFPYPGSMQILNAQKEDSGSYLCQATSAGITIRSQVELRVFVGPQFTVTPSDVQTSVGASVRLSCAATAVPAPNVFWSIPTGEQVVSPTLNPVSGILVFTNGTLYIAQVEEQHAGSFTCVAGNEVSTVTASAVVSVQYAPTFVVQPQNLDVLENSSPMLPCLGNGNPMPTVRWYYDDNPLPLQSGFMYSLMANGSLQINSVQRQQMGTYRCALTNTYGRVQASALLTILIPPNFEHDAQEVVTQGGESAMLDCMVSGTPPPTIHWERAGLVLALESNMVRLPNNSLYISDLQPHQFGEYVCFASNRAGSKTLKSSIVTPDMPEFVVPPSGKTSNVTDRVAFPCLAKSQQQVFYYWYLSDIDGTPLARLNNGLVTEGRGASAYVDEDGTLIFQSVQEVDQGWYLCIASNDFGSLTGTALLTVQVPPRLLSSNSSQVVGEGQSAVLRCSFWGNPKPRMSWQVPRGFKFSTNSTDYTITDEGLTVRAVDSKIHWGTWVCEACNLLGCARGTVELQVAGAPMLTGVESFRDPFTGDIILKCLVVSTSSPTVTYFMGGVKIDPLTPPLGHFFNPDGSLRISPLQELKSYACSAANNMGSTQDVYQLNVPDAPINIVTRPLTSNSIEVIWTDVKNGELPATGHAVQILPAGGDWTVVNSSVPGTTYTVQGLNPFAQYGVRVSAYNLLGSSDFSQIVPVRTLEGAPGPPSYVQVNLKGNTITITWEPTTVPNGPSENLAYEVVLKDLNSSAASIPMLHGNQAPYVAKISLDTYGNTLDVRVRTVNRNIMAYSAAVSVQYVLVEEAPKSSPTVTNVSSQGDRALYVTWTIPEDDTVSKFIVDYHMFNEPPDSARRHEILDGTATSFNITGLASGTTYLVRVAAANRGGSGPFSPNYQKKTDADPVGGSDGSEGPSIGLILGIIAAVIILVFLLIMLLVFCCYRRKKQAELIQMDIDRIYQEKKPPLYTNKGYESDTLTSRKSGLRGSYDLVAASQNQPVRSSGSAAFAISGNSITDGPPVATGSRQSSYNPAKRTPRSGHSSPRPVHTITAPDTPTSVRSSRRGTEADFEVNEMEYDEEIYVTGHNRPISPNPSAVYLVQGDTYPLFPPEKPPRLYAKKGETPNGLVFIDPESRYNTVPKMGTSPVMSEIHRSEKRKHRDVSPNNDYAVSSKRYGNSYNSLPRTNPRQASHSQQRRSRPQDYTNTPASLSTAHAVVTLPRKNYTRHTTNSMPRESSHGHYNSSHHGNRTPVPPTRTSSYENGSMRPDYGSSRPEYGSMPRPKSAASGVSRASAHSKGGVDKNNWSMSRNGIEDENGFWRQSRYDNSASLF